MSAAANPDAPIRILLVEDSETQALELRLFLESQGFAVERCATAEAALDQLNTRLPDLVDFARAHGMKIGTISDLIAYRHKHDNLVREVRRETVTSSHGGAWEMRIFADQITDTEHVVLSKGDITDGKPVLARTHALNALEDVLVQPEPTGEVIR